MKKATLIGWPRGRSTTMKLLRGLLHSPLGFLLVGGLGTGRHALLDHLPVLCLPAEMLTQRGAESRVVREAELLALGDQRRLAALQAFHDRGELVLGDLSAGLLGGVLLFR